MHSNYTETLQKKLNPSFYQEKWRKIALSTEPIDRRLATEAVNAAYDLLEISPPNLLFFDSPYAALRELEKHLGKQPGRKLKKRLGDRLWRPLERQLGDRLDPTLKQSLQRQLRINLGDGRLEDLKYKLERSLGNINCIRSDVWSWRCCLFDYYINELGYQHDLQKEWDVIQLLVSNCGWIFPYEKVCLVCDRPRIILFGERELFHAEGKPAIQFTDGYSLYYYQGVLLPEKYGALPPSQWQEEWTYDPDDNYELSQAIARGLGYTIITELTSEQEALIPVYQDKWKAIALSTVPIDPQKASQAIVAAYADIGKPAPEIIFCASPYAVTQILEQRGELGRPRLGKVYLRIIRVINSIKYQLEEPLFRLWSQLLSQVDVKLFGQLEKLSIDRWLLRFSWILWRQVARNFRSPYYQTIADDNIHRIITHGFSICWLTEFYIDVLGCHHHFKKEWDIFQSLCQTCSWMFPLEDICVVCDRPRILSFDNQRRLHGEGSPAIQFADGFSVYAYHGVNLPEKYGKLHPDKWQAEWILSEKNAELRRVLIREIGYARISQELLATEVDTWQEYELLRINSDVDIEPMYLIKVTCPSTGYIHVLRVPPDISSAREAIEWINWGINPESFALQT